MTTTGPGAAFAEGRLLREAARRRRLAHGGHPRGDVVMWILLMPVLSAGVTLSMLAAVLVGITPPLLLATPLPWLAGGAAVFATLHRRQREREAAAARRNPNGPVRTGPAFRYQGHMAHHPRRDAAFAEGRRLREAAEHRRRMLTQRHGHPAWAGQEQWSGHRPRRSVLMWISLVPAVSIAAGMLLLMAAVVGFTAFVALGALPMLAAGTIAFVAVRHGRRRRLRRGGSAGTVPVPARRPPPPRPDLAWGRARAGFHALRAEYAAHECDAMAVLRLPALSDVSVPSTGRFVDAFAEAQALDTDGFPGPAHAAAFAAAADRARRAWTAAREAAQRIRLSGLSAAERGTVERVIKLLTVARDSDSDPERLAAYARAKAELDKLDRTGVVHVPGPAKAVLDAAARNILPA